MKTCSICKERKPVSEFAASKTTKDGLFCYCRPCHNAWKRAKRRAGAWKAREEAYRKSPRQKAYYRAHARRPEVKAKKNILRKRLMEKYPERYRARYYVKNAIRDGKLPDKKSTKCQLASAECRGRMEYHHYLGYAPEHWLDVMPLCRFHHELIDRQ